jgi:hypothetical protein
LIWGFGVENGWNAESGGDEVFGVFGIYSNMKFPIHKNWCIE